MNRAGARVLDVIHGDIWVEYTRRSDARLVIPTNGIVNRSGDAVMGRGLALQVARRFPDVPAALGRALREQTARTPTSTYWSASPSNPPPYLVTALPHRLISFPVKKHWKDSADLSLIERSAWELAAWLRQPDVSGYGLSIILPCVGCGNGRLAWAQVRLRLEALDAYDIAGRVRVIDVAGIRR